MRKKIKKIQQRNVSNETELVMDNSISLLGKVFFFLNFCFICGMFTRYSERFARCTCLSLKPLKLNSQPFLYDKHSHVVYTLQSNAIRMMGWQQQKTLYFILWHDAHSVMKIVIDVWHSRRILYYYVCLSCQRKL